MNNKIKLVAQLQLYPSNYYVLVGAQEKIKQVHDYIAGKPVFFHSSAMFDIVGCVNATKEIELQKIA